MKGDFSKAKYDDRNSVAAGDQYGVGIPPKMGKMRASFMDTNVPQKSSTKVGKPPKK